jgi:hypothetical protein
LVLLGLTLPAVAVEHGQVMYFGGTVPALSVVLLGRIDTSSQTLLTFEFGTKKLAIPYTLIESFAYSTEVTHHLGVLPAIAVGLFKKRERRHFFRISYLDSDHAQQVAVFEVPKHMPRTLQAVLEARTSGKAAKSKGDLPCVPASPSFQCAEP